jgi:hypothetical protein
MKVNNRNILGILIAAALISMLAPSCRAAEEKFASIGRFSLDSVQAFLSGCDECGRS